MADQDAITALNHLIETCRNGELGFRNAATHVQDPGLRSMCHTIARQRARFAEELKQEVERLGSAPDEGGSVGGAVHRGWMDLKSALTGRDDTSILGEAERGEDVAVRAFEAALRAPLPESAEVIVDRQYKHVKETHDRVKALENEWKRRE